MFNNEKYYGQPSRTNNFQHNSAPEHYADIGVAFGITNNLQLDVNAGKGLNKNADDYFLTAGISFKL